MNLFLSKEDLIRWLDALLRQRVLVAPVRVQGLILLQPVSKVAEVTLDFGNTTLSPKGWFLPPMETLFSVQSNDGQQKLVPTTIEKDAVIFGLRPCDARGIALIDRPLLREPSDALYRERRARTSLIGLSCRQAQPECFCTSMGSAPNDPSHVDILLTEIDNGYILQVITEKGRALLSESFAEYKGTLPKPPEPGAVPTKEVVPAVKKLFDDPYWERLADRCLHCNICAYVCPTCYCFDVRDYSDKGSVERIRGWDSCQSPGFSRIAGGYNPRVTKGARLRQRFAHKLLYFPERFKDVACVGCGRCVRSCPVNIDIREVLRDLQQLEVKSGS
ncbi:MAG: sulfite reductase [Chloroflexi bacterium CG_4_9_14_3_um_filter_45_9]|nr:MAG: sulfite reductase [Chloroflexi bacterium CG08_land_8_20_14_0_20_45_12]PIX27653.1 MAG: sulfite reductase [Chloroflexi bacterium CG_4_8_14_3_um_filter_45_15]PJB49488.1 MAG: sulfite reductase [Chloroflexi bacterium CG_4_9_14_3_um_filter_45_9]